jgi:hypothetical protein
MTVYWRTANLQLSVPRFHLDTQYQATYTNGKLWDFEFADKLLKESTVCIREATAKEITTDTQTLEQLNLELNKKWHKFIVPREQRKCQNTVCTAYIKILREQFLNANSDYSDGKNSNLGLWNFTFPIWIVQRWLEDLQAVQKKLPSNRRRFSKLPDIYYDFLDKEDHTSDGKSKTERLADFAKIPAVLHIMQKTLVHDSAIANDTQVSFDEIRAKRLRRLFKSEERRHEEFKKFLDANQNMLDHKNLTWIQNLFTLRARVAWLNLIRAIDSSLSQTKNSDDETGVEAFAEARALYGIHKVNNAGEVKEKPTALDDPRKLIGGKKNEPFVFAKEDKYKPHYVKNFQILGAQMHDVVADNVYMI